ncbi:bifunctional 2-polyprenyl-6-hydroxyphenol methylase/3-demethylubiquinol 3-O-methyltransferase UbiG [Sphingomonas oryzagri]|uniref:Ubiquinone biosynthesis O-methyltransferase n=1 Tax=Sphingomonas oryzagri TaxID=3042314 RepID=A0ABT6N2I7_9SPHN|nr:bifunctional 2-polyprenyl-6-hydroxyphenol methylase/3-demethylubiquinol 3-O-methyltransferase UbiG [Sphingomonas oryzagri]MDH7639503.1 bifunctional 2-polyprenyl-6-hydroxyphenol methylase/3-demethylubiquinol 3-O-methyltransferase UbiG [Sphingomonas oryzagri]
MTDATIIPAPAGGTIDPQEAAHFGKLAAEWWDPKGSSAMLHKLNPVRLGFVREMVDQHFGTGRTERRPLAGRRALDVGCGAGLLTEPLARMGATATGLDAAPENIAAAALHAEGQGLAIDYRHGSVEKLGEDETFDLVCSMEVVEHVTDPAAFVAGLAKALAPGGLMLLSTPNRTALSRLALITVGEGTGQIPKGTHDWQKFLQPGELEALLQQAGLKVIETRGLSLDPMKGFVLSNDVRMDYLMGVVRA